MVAARGKIKHGDAVARHEFRIGRGSRGCQRQPEVCGQHRNLPVRRTFTADQHVVDIGVGAQLIYRAHHVGEANALVPGERLRGVDVTLHQNARVQRRPQVCDLHEIAVT